MIELVAKYLSGNASLEEQEQVEEWRNQNQQEFLSYSEAWATAHVNAFDKESARAAVMGRISTQNRFEQKTKGSAGFTWRLAGIAAAVSLLLGIAYFLFVGGSNSTASDLIVDGWEVVETDKGETKEVNLADGSTVSMSELSRLSYPLQFGDERRIVFNGKGFFDVVPDKEHPFRVETIEALVTVVGTSFQIKTESIAKFSEVIVETGIVTLARKPQPNVAEKSIEVDLRPGEAGVVRREAKGVSKSKNMNQNYLAWKTNKMVFNSTAMSDVITTLNEVYNVDIKLTNKEIADCRLTATFDRKPINEVIEVIKQTFSFEVENSRNEYEISGKACR